MERNYLHIFRELGQLNIMEKEDVNNGIFFRFTLEIYEDWKVDYVKVVTFT